MWGGGQCEGEQGGAGQEGGEAKRAGHGQGCHQRGGIQAGPRTVVTSRQALPRAACRCPCPAGAAACQHNREVDLEEGRGGGGRAGCKSRAEGLRAEQGCAGLGI